jgi:hypothetical protein
VEKLEVHLEMSEGIVFALGVRMRDAGEGMDEGKKHTH